MFLPAAGNRNNTSLNNQGTNGNYWSSSLNTDNPRNAWNFNFNSGNSNMNNNNRYNGFSVRPVLVQALTFFYNLSNWHGLPTIAPSAPARPLSGL